MPYSDNELILMDEARGIILEEKLKVHPQVARQATHAFQLEVCLVRGVAED